MADDVLRPIPTNVVRLTGPLLVGHLLNWGLFGVLSVQCYIYYLAFPKDRTVIKSLVGFMLVIELLQTVLSTRDAFREFGSGWGKVEELDNVGWLWFSIPLIEAIVSCTSQLFYAWRIWIISASLWIPGIISLLALMQGVTGVYTSIYAHILHNVSKFQERSFSSTSVWLGGTALCDIIITASMIYYLQQARKQHQSTTTLLTKFINITVQTGLVCAAFAILDLAFFIASPKENFYFTPNLVLSKLYSNSLLVIFNARIEILGGRNTAQDDMFLSVVSTAFKARTGGTTTQSRTTPRCTPTPTGIYPTYHSNSHRGQRPYGGGSGIGGITVEISRCREVDVEAGGRSPVGSGKTAVDPRTEDLKSFMD